MTSHPSSPRASATVRELKRNLKIPTWAQTSPVIQGFRARLHKAPMQHSLSSAQTIVVCKFQCTVLLHVMTEHYRVAFAHCTVETLKHRRDSRAESDSSSCRHACLPLRGTISFRIPLRTILVPEYPSLSCLQRRISSPTRIYHIGQRDTCRTSSQPPGFLTC